MTVRNIAVREAKSSLKTTANPTSDTDWRRVPVSHLAKVTLWRVEAGLYSLLDAKTQDLGRQLPDYYGSENPAELSMQTKDRLKQAAWERFRSMDLFFVKVCG